MNLIAILFSNLLIFDVISFSLSPTECTNNKQVNSYSEYISEFKKGPCSPLIFVPGLMGTNLRVVADCKIMKAHQETDSRIAKLLNVCPFMCKNRDHYENSVWVNDKSMIHYLLFNEFNLIFKKRECLVEMFKVYHEFESDSKLYQNKCNSQDHYKQIFLKGKFIKI